MDSKEQSSIQDILQNSRTKHSIILSDFSQHSVIFWNQEYEHGMGQPHIPGNNLQTCSRCYCVHFHWIYESITLSQQCMWLQTTLNEILLGVVVLTMQCVFASTQESKNALEVSPKKFSWIFRNRNSHLCLCQNIEMERNRAIHFFLRVFLIGKIVLVPAAVV